MFKQFTIRTFIVFMIFGGAAFAQIANISGTVTNDGKPVPNTTLWFAADDTSLGIPVKPVDTDTAGNFSQNWFTTPTTITPHDSFSYNPISISVSPTDFPPTTTVDIVLETRTQDSNFSGTVTFDGAGYATEMFMQKLPSDIDPDDFTEVENLYISPVNAGRWASYSLTSDGNGDFSIDVLNGNYIVFIPGTPDVLPSWSVVTIQGDVSGHQIDMRKKVHISGAVSNSEGYDYVTIFGHPVNAGRAFMADAWNGEYDVAVAPGDYVLRLQAFFTVDSTMHVYTVFYDGVYSHDEATVVDASSDVSGINFDLPDPVISPYTVTGTVTDAADGSAIVGASVNILPKNGSPNMYMSTGDVTDEKGSYSITGYTMIPEDSLVAFVWADGYFSEFYEDEATYLTADAVVYHPNETVTVDFVLNAIDTTAGFGISGTVTDTSGNIIGFGQVTAYTTDTNVGQTYVQIDENGNYEFPAIFPTGSTVLLQCWVGYGYKPQMYDGAETWEDATPIEIGTDNITGADFNLTPVPARRPIIGSIIGSVKPNGFGKTTSSDVYAGSMVYVKQQGTDEWQEVDYVDENGSFKLGIEGKGNYDLLLTSPDRENVTGSVEVKNNLVVETEISLGVTGIGDINEAKIAKSNKLYSAYPNPFNPRTTIKVELVKTENVSLTIYNVTGQKVKTLHRGLLQSGLSKFVWDSKDQSGNVVASGMYFIQLKTQNGLQTKSMIFLK
ncbi:MAG: T9SS C-terminal target domain-containing protein [Calditrichaeota bacterium]|nr:MAG: T9SS C-terminal target domain-containing protein [Calditrichota bacterium]MBL1204455.1 T9SS C-terminal target domain-containing protein [Calditrichota bacterium]NOG44284.1 T9SS type A sorting domain-containing protein [Calditrichota bacterium]